MFCHDYFRRLKPRFTYAAATDAADDAATFRCCYFRCFSLPLRHFLLMLFDAAAAWHATLTSDDKYATATPIRVISIFRMMIFATILIAAFAAAFMPLLSLL